MQRQNLGKRIKELRSIQGISQEFLAEESGLSIRTIQRIEKDETTPNGDTYRRLSDALKVNLNELMNWTAIEDIHFLKKLNLSALSFIFFPPLGVLVPSIIWLLKKGQIKDADEVARTLINFEIIWTIIFFATPFFVVPTLYLLTEIFLQIFDIRNQLHPNFGIDSQVIWVLMYLINVLFIMLNTSRIHDEKKLKYFPSVKFLKSWGKQ